MFEFFCHLRIINFIYVKALLYQLNLASTMAVMTSNLSKSPVCPCRWFAATCGPTSRRL